jgi:hypothetical protein
VCDGCQPVFGDVQFCETQCCRRGSTNSERLGISFLRGVIAEALDESRPPLTRPCRKRVLRAASGTLPEDKPRRSLAVMVLSAGLLGLPGTRSRLLDMPIPRFWAWLRCWTTIAQHHEARAQSGVAASQTAAQAVWLASFDAPSATPPGSYCAPIRLSFQTLAHRRLLFRAARCAVRRHHCMALCSILDHRETRDVQETWWREVSMREEAGMACREHGWASWAQGYELCSSK